MARGKSRAFLHRKNRPSIRKIKKQRRESTLKMLWINKQNHAQPELRTKQNYRGRTIENQIISKKTNLLITGNHHSGKTRAITRLFENSREIWELQIKPYAYTRGTLATNKPMLNQNESLKNWTYPPAVFICGNAPLSKWVDHAGMEKWWNENNENEPFKKIPAWKRCEVIAKYLRATRAVLFVDDAHKLTGRKLKIAQECIDRAFRVVIACTDENRLSPSIRKRFLETKPQIIRLNSEVAYDATHVLAWLFVLIAMLAGSPEIAAAIGLFEVMKGGRRASKQD
jgi:hypothetical protein